MKTKPITEMTLAESRLYTAKLNFKIMADVIEGKTTVPKEYDVLEYTAYLTARGMIDLIEYFELKEGK